MNKDRKNLTEFPEIASEWNYEKNYPLKPEDFSAGSNKKVYWLCSKNHTYGPKSIYERTRQDGKATGCPYCSNKKVLTGYNDLETWCHKEQHEEILQQWDYEKNEKLPSEYVPHTDKKVWWICKKNHSYLMKLCEKTKNKPFGCPICSNKQLLVGYNDLKTLFPEIANEWDYENNNTRPEDYIPGNHTKVWWVCNRCGNHWQASIKERARHGTGCPECSFYFKTSTPEQAIYFYIKKLFPDALNSFKPNYLGGMEIDIYIPSIMVGIEYDGKKWHDNEKRDNRKSLLLKENRIKLIRIKETNNINNFNDYKVIKSDYHSQLSDLKPTIYELLTELSNITNRNIDISINIENDAANIYVLSEGNKKQKSLLATNHVALREWAYDLNGDLTPDKITPGSNKTAWWRCIKCGNVWQQSIRRKLISGLNCESCNKTAANNKRIQEKIKLGKIKTIADYPNLLKEWNDSRNPKTITEGNDKHALWKCSVCGNEFKMIVKNRTKQGQGCPICGRKKSVISRARPVINTDTGEEFYSLSEASRIYHISSSCIKNCCNNKQSKAGGYSWKFK